MVVNGKGNRDDHIPFVFASGRIGFIFIRHVDDAGASAGGGRASDRAFSKAFDGDQDAGISGRYWSDGRAAVLLRCDGAAGRSD